MAAEYQRGTLVSYKTIADFQEDSKFRSAGLVSQKVAAEMIAVRAGLQMPVLATDLPDKRGFWVEELGGRVHVRCTHCGANPYLPLSLVGSDCDLPRPNGGVCSGRLELVEEVGNG